MEKKQLKKQIREGVEQGLKIAKAIKEMAPKHGAKKEKERGKGRQKETPHLRLRAADQKRVEYRDGIMEQKKLPGIMSAWDAMAVQKCDPGSANVAYVAGMNVTQCPTMTFTVANTAS